MYESKGALDTTHNCQGNNDGTLRIVVFMVILIYSVFGKLKQDYLIIIIVGHYN